jgi:phosphoglycolate phosphatase-like HAD superfamily hydrolase
MEGKDSVSLKDYAAYVFDLDGTLFTIPVDWVEVRDEVGKMAGAPIGDTPLFLEVEQLVSIRPSMRQTLFAMLDSHELKAVAEASPVSGALELLSHLSKVAKLGLVTMQGTAACDKILGRYRLGELFDVMVTREDSLDRAVQLRIALQSLASPPKDTLFTGDRLSDVVCGRRAGVDTVLLGRELLGDVRPDYAFPALTMLKDSID